MYRVGLLFVYIDMDGFFLVGFAFSTTIYIYIYKIWKNYDMRWYNIWIFLRHNNKRYNKYFYNNIIYDIFTIYEYGYRRKLW